ncbi:putative glycoside hydrolase family 92 protein [Rosellinia necatrix]|uniref:Putative glycoside hydrolase family 92 protein n=1 Tax=Rosellinia necatrix TaxID=77044 RepID=A0A1W2TI50_ROSNE|nr:putative glycoside hydrolase family 92 protein [Rosellinia necatrix]
MRDTMPFSLSRLGLLAFAGAASAQVDYSQYVNPFIGGLGPFDGLAYGGGDIFVGGAVPFGVVKMGIDTYEENVTWATLNGGWTPKGLVTGVSMMHEHGTGGGPKYGIVAQMPLTSIDHPVNILDNTTYWQRRVGDDVASVGYYKTEFENGIKIELSGARHAGIVQYSFPDGEKHVLVDVSHYLPSIGDGASGQMFLDGEISIDGAQYTGYTTTRGGFGLGAPFTVYFCGEFESEPEQARTFRGRNTDPNPGYRSFSGEPIGQAMFSSFGAMGEKSGPLSDRVGAVFSWGANASAQVKSRIGISMISAEKACKFKDEEIPSWDLNKTVSAAVDEWNKDVFSRIQVPTDESANRTNLVLLYSSLYMMHLMPSDRTGENPLWESDEPSWDDFYAIWDTFRCTVSLLHLIQPKAYEGQIRSLIDIWRHEGFMPDSRSGNCNGITQGGSDADNVLADAYVKGLRGGINWTAGYQAMVKDAEVTPPNTFALNDLKASVKEGRGALDDWKKLGYVSTDNTRCISRSVEYSLNDYALSVVAAGEAPQDVEKYLNRAAGWQHLWNADVESVGFKGFLTPKNGDGTWDDDGYNPAKCGGCSWGSITYEGTPWEYSFSIPHDMKNLVQLMGGEAEFERRLDYIFLPNTSQADLGPNGARITSIMNIGNEPDFATPYHYNYINKQHKSVNQSRSLSNQYFDDTMRGVPGNSDSGALNSWLIWQMLGLYPVVTQPVYLLASPWFGDVNVTVGANATLRITSDGADPAALGHRGFYVRSVKINGEPWDRNWFDHEDVMVRGGTIEFAVGDEPLVWETGDVPPSPGHVAFKG